MFDNSPRDPTMTTSIGLPTSVIKTSILTDEVMETGRTGSIEEPLYSFHEDREAQRKEKNAIDEGTQDFGSLPTIGVLGRSRLVRSELIIQALDSA